MASLTCNSINSSNCFEPEEFEGVLRPAYEADEWKLILTGSLLGMGAGFMQLYYVFM